MNRYEQIEDRAARRDLWLLVWIRWLILTGVMAALTLAQGVLQFTLPVVPMVAVTGVLVGLNLWAIWGLRRPGPLSMAWVAFELLADLLAMTALLYLTGGAGNPLVFLLILQVIIAAALLSPGYALLIWVAAFTCYGWLMNHGLPLSGMASTGANGWDDLHQRGMYLSFVLASAALTYFLSRFHEGMRLRNEQAAQTHVRLMEDDHLVRLGLLSSGAAHELGTPLTTLAVTLDDWKSFGPPQGPEAKAEIESLLTQVARCKTIVSQMLLASGQERLEAAHPVPARAHLGAVAADWAAVNRAEVRFTSDLPETAAIVADPMLAQALRNLLDNARAAAPDQPINVRLEAAGAAVRLSVADRGAGFPPNVLARPGAAFQSSHEGPGRGLGLYLVRNGLRRLGGSLSLENPPEGGARAVLTLPRLTGGSHV